MTKYIDIVFDGPPGPESGRFVEVEDDAGTSISVGEWVETPPYWRLRIQEDKRIAELEQELKVYGAALRTEVGLRLDLEAEKKAETKVPCELCDGKRLVLIEDICTNEWVPCPYCSEGGGERRRAAALRRLGEIERLKARLEKLEALS